MGRCENGVMPFRKMSTQQTILTWQRQKEPVLHTIWGAEIGYISQLYELKMLDIYTKR